MLQYNITSAVDCNTIAYRTKDNKTEKNLYKRALKLIQKYDTIIIHRHTHPDGDAIGSQVGLAETIKANFPTKTVYIVGDDPGRFAFVPDSTPDEVPDSAYANALAIVLDCGASHMVSDERYQTAKCTLRVDHHLKCEEFCTMEIVDSTYESCCGLLYDMLRAVRLPLNDAAAKALFTGLVTDSGRFRYDSTTCRTFAIAAELCKYDFAPTDIYDQLYADDLSAVQTRAKFVQKICVTPKGNGYIYNTAEEVAASGLTEFAVSRGMVGVMSDIKGMDSWVNFTETADGVQCELRSRKYNINPVAVKYGGGGHKKASGCTVPDRATAMLLLADIDALTE